MHNRPCPSLDAVLAKTVPISQTVAALRRAGFAPYLVGAGAGRVRAQESWTQAWVGMRAMSCHPLPTRHHLQYSGDLALES